MILLRTGTVFSCHFEKCLFLHFFKTKGDFMFARLTFISVQPESIDELKRIYNEEVVRVVKSQKGNIGVWLLEPTDRADDFISLTEWRSEAEANAYESSGTYRELVNKLKDKYKSKPVLKTYNVAETKVAVTM